MAEGYQVTKTSRSTAEVDDKILTSTNSTRLILRPLIIVHNLKDPNAKVKIELIHQRKTPNGQWQDDPGEPLSKLRAGEQIKLSLDSATTLELFRQLKHMYPLAEQPSFSFSGSAHVIELEDNIIETDERRARLINTLLSKGYSDQVWQELIKANPDLATSLSHARIQEERTKALGKFEANLGNQRDESWWQTFFEQNTWIFGYGLKYQFLDLVSKQPHYGGADVEGKGMEKGDFLTHTSADIKFTVLLEIKKPDSPLLGKAKYRNGAWQLGEELVGGVSQLQANCEQWNISGSRSAENNELLLQEKIFTVSPKGILVIGKTAQLEGNPAGRNTFERFRRSLSNPEVITYDELYERAKFIVGHPAGTGHSPEIKSGNDAMLEVAAPMDDGDIPF